MQFRSHNTDDTIEYIKSKIDLNYTDENFQVKVNNLVNYGEVFSTVLNLNNCTDDQFKIIIGKNGFYFHKTTLLCDISFIWHNRNNGLIEFWGVDKKNLTKAVNVIKNRYNIIKQRMTVEQSAAQNLTK